MDKPLFVITDPGTVTLVTGAYAVVIDKKTGTIASFSSVCLTRSGRVQERRISCP